MAVLPSALTDLIEALGLISGVGPRTAERYAFHILKSSPAKADRLAAKLTKLHKDIATCPVTFALVESGQQISPLYSNPNRDKQTVAVVEDALDIVALENTGNFNGTYHVLGGALSPIDGVGPEHLHVPELIKRIQSDNVKEIILATNASVEGESTALYIKSKLTEVNVSLTRLARGISAGTDLEYADQITLSRALEGRQSL